GAARSVDQDRAFLHGADFFLANHHLRGRQLRHVQRNDVGQTQQFGQAGDLGCVTQRQLGQRVEEEDLHAQAFSQNRQLSTDRAVADDAQFLATDFERVGSAFDPATTVAGSVLFRDA
nr:hypothetical protein [Tanacetum cinerariifolium]